MTGVFTLIWFNGAEKLDSKIYLGNIITLLDLASEENAHHDYGQLSSGSETIQQKSEIYAVNI